MPCLSLRHPPFANNSRMLTERTAVRNILIVFYYLFYFGACAAYVSAGKMLLFYLREMDTHPERVAY